MFAPCDARRTAQETVAASASSRMLSRMLCASTGIITFRSKFPSAPAQVNGVVADYLMHTWISASLITGFTLPGMMELPGCVSGSRISLMPQRGPLLPPDVVCDFVRVFTRWFSTARSPADESVLRGLRLKVVARLPEAMPVRFCTAHHLDGEIRMAVQPCPPPSPQRKFIAAIAFPARNREYSTCFINRHLVEADRRCIHQVRVRS